jgi:nitric oxide reductase NorQ protein
MAHLHRPSGAPWYLPAGDEVEVFLQAYAAKLPVLLLGPTGSGKTRFVEHMAARLATLDSWTGCAAMPLLTVSCHDDLSSTDLVGRHLLDERGTVWLDGPLVRAARQGSICYLDEFVEARRDTTVVIHSLTDHRRELWIERTGERLTAHPGFLLVASYNPQPLALKALKPSTRQRFVVLEFSYLREEDEAQILVQETGVAPSIAERLASLATKVRAIDQRSLVDGVSTRAMVHAAELIQRGVQPRRACHSAITLSVTDDPIVRHAIAELVDVVLS